MKLTKYGHSCFALEQSGEVLVIDPGAWATDFTSPNGVVGVVITHEHADHFDEEKLQTIIDKNPGAIIYAPVDVTTKIPNLPTEVVSTGDLVQARAFTLEFTGGAHATIHKDFHSKFQNLGVIVNDILYHPGDSLALPGKPIKVLSLPIVAPWEKVSESIDFLMKVNPELIFPTHDAMLSELGIGLYDRWHSLAAEKLGANYKRLASGETIDI